ncbi:MAG TPA: glycosyltransferase family 92 protein [Chlamydiales bacterium]|nr:glycosyltransferase family 92 protein [Chlamydiales bacterium]
MIGIAAIFRNEAPYLKEWIEFHRLVGVEKFYLFDNLSTDAFQAVLEPYRNIVELTHWPLEHSNVLEWNEIQCLAYERALHKAKGHVKWLAILDIDEFLFSPTRSLSDVLAPFEQVGGIGVNWQAFGTSSVSEIRPEELLIETLNFKFPEQIGTNHHIKSIVRPERVRSCNNPHFVIYEPPFSQVTTDGTPFEGRLSPTIRIDLLRINHYTLRDETYFRKQKIPRLEKWWNGINVGDWEAKYKESAQVEDRTIHRFVPQLKAACSSCAVRGG